MSRPKVALRDPVFAAILAFLLPGMGHFYQRRIFKGVLYAVCILGTFFTGLRIGHGQVVYFNWKQPDNKTYAYLCQFWVGLPALPALAQSQLRSHEAFAPNFVPKVFTSRFEGTLTEPIGSDSRLIGNVTGTITVQPQQPDTPRHWTATVKGTLKGADGSSQITGEITNGGMERDGLGPEVAPWPERRIAGMFDWKVDGDEGPVQHGRLIGSIPRPIRNSFEAPLQDPRVNDFGGDASDLDRAHMELGGRFELGVVYTMIAGLLNILAIYDALEGPAYEDEEDDGDEEDTDKLPPDPKPQEVT